MMIPLVYVIAGTLIIDRYYTHFRVQGHETLISAKSE